MATKTKTDSRKVRNTQFGEFEIEEKHIFNFENGLLGFDNLRRFVLINEEETAPFKWLICIDEPEIGFPLLSPWHIDLKYNPGKEINSEKDVIFVVITLEDDKGLMTANMKAPVVLDVENQTGKQIILPKDKYQPDYIIPKKVENAE